MYLNRINKLLPLINNLGILVDSINQILLPFYENHNASVDNYDKWKENQEKIQYLSNPVYKIYELKNRNSVNTLVANVKWKFLYNGKFLEDKSILVYLGTIEKYPKKEKDSKLLYDINSIIYNHFLEKSPLHTVDMDDLSEMKYQIELYYYWKSKLVELEYRLSPDWYKSKSKVDKPEQVIINIKWGFEVPGKENKPRYILKRLNLEKYNYTKLSDLELEDIFKKVTLEHINRVAPLSFNPPTKK
ncbi:hypothetical protein [Flavobacterium sp.]|jgi:hypothetical protein|uniref:hypothetical protein n=1 Tax=Flavobacterium sp. TaxID=239 RepID=UPI0037C12CB3